MAVSKRMRFEVLKRDGFRCRYCGVTAAASELTVDHVTPVALGGADEPSNLVAACGACNSGKSSTTPDAPLVDDVAEDAVRWAAAMKQAAANLTERDQVAIDYRDTFLGHWGNWAKPGQLRARVALPDGWKQSVERFRTAGLPVEMWAEVVELGMTTNKIANPDVFRYCCGIAWNKVTALQEEARRIIVGAEPPSVDQVATYPADLWEWIEKAVEQWSLAWGYWEYMNTGEETGCDAEQENTVRRALHWAVRDGGHARWILWFAMTRLGLESRCNLHEELTYLTSLNKGAAPCADDELDRLLAAGAGDWDSEHRSRFTSVDPVIFVDQRCGEAWWSAWTKAGHGPAPQEQHDAVVFGLYAGLLLGYGEDALTDLAARLGSLGRCDAAAHVQPVDADGIAQEPVSG